MPVTFTINLLLVVWVAVIVLVLGGFTTGATLSWLFVAPTADPVARAFIALVGGWVGMAAALVTGNAALLALIEIRRRRAGEES